MGRESPSLVNVDEAALPPHGLSVHCRPHSQGAAWTRDRNSIPSSIFCLSQWTLWTLRVNRCPQYSKHLLNAIWFLYKISWGTRPKSKCLVLFHVIFNKMTNCVFNKATMSSASHKLFLQCAINIFLTHLKNAKYSIFKLFCEKLSLYTWASLISQLVKNPPAMQVWWVRKICWRRERLPTPVFWSREFHGLYSSWIRKELDMTERLGEGNGNPLQYSCLENPMDGGA